MAKYDHGGGCPCGLYRECEPGCRNHKDYKPPAKPKMVTIDKAVSVAAAVMDETGDRVSRASFLRILRKTLETV